MSGGKPGRFRAVTPIVPATDLKRSIAFFETALGFETRLARDDYAFLRRDDVAVRLVQTTPDFDAADPARQMHIYIDVDGLDALYAEMRPALSALPPGRVRAPFDTDYGQREFHVIDEDVLLISFGEPIVTSKT